MMNKTSHNSLINGIASDYLTINDRSIHYGDGLFETLLCSAGQLYYWPQHYQRLQQSAQFLGIDCPDQQLLLEDIKKLLTINDYDITNACAIKIIISRGAGERGYKIAKNSCCNRLLLVSNIENNHSSLLNLELLSGELFICQQQVSINENLAGIKHLNRLENVLARNEWSEDYIDGVMLNANKHVIEGTMSNIFAVKDEQLFTPNLKLSGVNGIMRNVIIDIAKRNNIQTSVLDITLDELIAMDEIFISNSLIGMKAVTKISPLPSTAQSTEQCFQKPKLAMTIFKELVKIRGDNVQTV